MNGTLAFAKKETAPATPGPEVFPEVRKFARLVACCTLLVTEVVDAVLEIASTEVLEASEVDGLDEDVEDVVLLEAGEALSVVPDVEVLLDAASLEAGLLDDDVVVLEVELSPGEEAPATATVGALDAAAKM